VVEVVQWKLYLQEQQGEAKEEDEEEMTEEEELDEEQQYFGQEYEGFEDDQERALTFKFPIPILNIYQ